MVTVKAKLIVTQQIQYEVSLKLDHSRFS